MVTSEQRLVVIGINGSDRAARKKFREQEIRHVELARVASGIKPAAAVSDAQNLRVAPPRLASPLTTEECIGD